MLVTAGTSSHTNWQADSRFTDLALDLPGRRRKPYDPCGGRIAVWADSLWRTSTPPV